MRFLSRSAWAATFAAALVAVGCAGPRRLDPKQPWHGKNRAALDAMIAAHGKHGAGYDSARAPVATFDWDNTSIKNDAGDATMYWMLRNAKVLQPPGKKWRKTSRYLTDAGVSALDAACGSLALPGEALPTHENAACATEIVSIYGEGKTAAGEAAFAGWNHRRMEPGYAFGVALEAGHSPDEVRAFARAAMTENLAHAIGVTQSVGRVNGLPAYVRFHEPIRDLVATLTDEGITPWVVSASSQYVVEPYAAEYGIPAAHVIGIRPILRDGLLTYDLEGCGDVPDGTNDGAGHAAGNSLVTYVDGKRCWINKVIFGDTSARALERNADERRRPLLTAGDSDTDITFLRDATAAHLVLNRQRLEVMCHAYRDADGHWLVNPMFVEPLPQRVAPYPCSTAACRDENGVLGPCRDDHGDVIPDQHDTVFAP